MDGPIVVGHRDFDPIEIEVSPAGGVMDVHMRWERTGPFKDFVYSFANEKGGPWMGIRFVHVIAQAYYGDWNLQPAWLGVNRLVRNPDFDTYRRGPSFFAHEFGAYVDGGGGISAVCETVVLEGPFNDAR